MHEHIEALQAPQGRRLHLWFEPWAMGLAVPAGKAVELRASSPHPGRLEFEMTEERTAIYGWPGSTLQVLMDGQVVESFDLAVPANLTKEIVSLLFGKAPVPGMQRP
jgi:hypothetical protein